MTTRQGENKQMLQYEVAGAKVTDTTHRLICDCQDHVKLGSDCNHIMETINLLKQSRNIPFTMIEMDECKICKHCKSGDIILKEVRHNKSGDVRRYYCKACHKKFSGNFGFRYRQFDDSVITGSFNMFFAGMSTRDIADYYQQMGVSVDNSTIYRWLKRYVQFAAKYLKTVRPQVGEKWRTDEMYLDISGNPKYIYSMMDEDSRFVLDMRTADTKGMEDVRPMFQAAQNFAGMIPATFISDGARNFHLAWKELWKSRNFLWKTTSHIRHIRLAGDLNNNMMERFNGTVRDREVALRGLKKMDSEIVPGFAIFYNYVKKHGGLRGATPAEAAGIHIRGNNKLKTIIQNASLHYAESN